MAAPVALMRPKTVSASALTTAAGCLARYKAENLEFTPRDSPSVAADIGTSCHHALEAYVKRVYMDKTDEPSLELLLELYVIGYRETFDSHDIKTPEFKDGKEMLEVWFDRTDLSDVTVLSVEEKWRRPLPTSAGEIPLTFIWDRCEFQVENGRRVLRIVDYKSIRANLTPDDLRVNLQARIYAMTAMIMYADQGIDEYQVVFDLLRHEPVGVVFSAEEARETYDEVIAMTERILRTPLDRTPETLNENCSWCVRKTTCSALRRNIAGGGLKAVEAMPLEEQMALAFELQAQAKAAALAADDIKGAIMTTLNRSEKNKLHAGDYVAAISTRRMPSIPTSTAIKVLGADLVASSGKVTQAALKKLLTTNQITQEQHDEVMNSIVRTPSTSLTIKKEVKK